MRRHLPVFMLALLLLACERPHVLVLGLDGATWDVMDPLMEAGRLPALARVVREGARGEHDCTPAMPNFPCFCPPVWVSLATGQPQARHRITREGQPSTLRGVKAVWELLHELGGTATTLSARNSSPPEDSVDWVVTEAGMDWAASQIFARWPAPLPITAYVPELRTKPLDLFEALSLLPVVEQGPPVWAMPARDRVAMALLPRLLRVDRSNLTWLVLHSPDKSEHLTWDEVQPHEGAPVDPERVLAVASRYEGPVSGTAPEGWGNAASQYLEIDAWLGALLARFHFDYVVLVSDHGMARNEGDGLPGEHGPGFSDAHRGILAIRGPGVRRGADIGRVDVLDFAPTLAYLLELPVGDDLPGRVLEEAFTRGQLRRRPVWRVASWEQELAGWRPPRAPQHDWIRKRERERRTGRASWR